jgi:hypothetical protein
MTIPLFIFSIFLVVMMYLLYADRKKQERETIKEENVEMDPTDAPPKYTESTSVPLYTESKGTEVV